MYTLESFYRSKAWQKLLAQLKMERLNEEGQIICDYCGKPIVRAYDIIGHHKEELTEANVNDFNISLNPANISFVHHKCHNFIHNKFGYAVREVYLVYGAPMSGKSEWVRENMSEGDLVVNVDEIWKAVSGCDKYVKPNRLRSVVFKVRDGLIEAVRYRAGKWNNAYIIGGYALSSERLRLCKELGAREVYIESSFDSCCEKLKRYEYLDQNEWTKYILDWFSKHTPPMESGES